MRHKFLARHGETRAQVRVRAYVHLHSTAWAKGGIHQGKPVPAATERGLRAGARKLADVAMARLHAAA